jgi:hypothetical protein
MCRRRWPWKQMCAPQMVVWMPLIIMKYTSRVLGWFGTNSREISRELHDFRSRAATVAHPSAGVRTADKRTSLRLANIGAAGKFAAAREPFRKFFRNCFIAYCWRRKAVKLFMYLLSSHRLTWTGKNVRNITSRLPAEMGGPVDLCIAWEVLTS